MLLEGKIQRESLADLSERLGKVSYRLAVADSMALM